jgi:hypothetical protein
VPQPKKKQHRQAAADPEKISYLVQRERAPDFVLEVPADWKMTFGAVNPGSQSHSHLHCVRVWEGEKLRAVFCDVRGFRDLSLPLAMKIERETGSASWEQDSTGNFERTAKRQIESSYVEDPPGIPF